MDRKRFVLSWGRKMFFGLSWPLMSLIGLLYLQSFIFPDSFLGWVYFLFTNIGHYGLINALLYFLFFYPVISISPSYYVSRIWSTLLITIANLFVLFDAIIFYQYRFHINTMVVEFLMKGGLQNVLESSSSMFVMAAIGVVIALFVLWIKGNTTWRFMRSRFSNPVSNAYLVVIAACFIMSHLLHVFADARGNNNVTRLAALFPMNFASTAKGVLHHHELVDVVIDANGKKRHEIFYPAKELRCSGKEKKNILFIVVNSLTSQELNPELTPNMHHYASHGAIFESHYGAGNSAEEGLFSLIYSLPPTYLTSVKNTGTDSVLMEELARRQYTVKAQSEAGKTAMEKGEAITADWKQWTSSYKKSEGEEQPFFAMLKYDLSTWLTRNEAIRSVDVFAGEIIRDLYDKGLMNKTIVVMTAASASPSATSIPARLETPMAVVWPGRKAAQLTHVTSHYDVVPTLMKDLWKCQNAAADYSYGSSLYDSTSRKWHVVGNTSRLSILDFRNNLITTIDSMKRYKVQDFSLNEVPKVKASNTGIFEILRDLNRFHRRK